MVRIVRRILAHLQHLWLRLQQRLQPLPHFVAKNWAWRLVSIVLAIIVWAYVQITTSTTVILSVPLDAIKVGEQFQAQAFTTNGEPLSLLHVAVQCAYRDKDKLRDSDYAAEIDLRDEAENIIPSYALKAGEQVVYRGPERYQKLSTVQAIVPDRIRITIDRTIQKNVPVEPLLVGEPRDGYQVSSVAANPAAVMVKGPARVMATLQSVQTEVIDITDLSKPLVKNNVRIVATNLPVIIVEKTPLEVRIGINTKPVERTLRSIPVAALGRPRYAAGVQFAPANVDLIVQGTRDLVSLIDPRSVLVFVDVRDVTSSGFRMPVQAISPANCNVISVLPQVVSVTLKEQ
ncbi:MAG: CdaR family protein [bacterium]|nr:CdaR family protein [bacterium]